MHIKKYLLALFLIPALLGTGCEPKRMGDAARLGAPSKTVDVQREAFDYFLVQLNKIIIKSKINAVQHKAFISYAWEDNDTKSNIAENVRIQKLLLTLHDDLESIGINTFLDIKNLSGNIRESMKTNINKSNIIFVIGTQTFKKKSTNDRLFLLPYYHEKIIPSQGTIVALVAAPDFYTTYYIEDGKTKEVIMSKIDISDIKWLDTENSIKEAQPSESTNAMLEKIFHRLESRKYKDVTNVQYEMGVYMDNLNNSKNTLMPIIFEGSIEKSFPSVMKNFLIRNIRKQPDYYYQMMALTNPLGIIPTIFPELIRNYEYVKLVNDMEKKWG